MISGLKAHWERILITLLLASIWSGSLALHGFRGDVQSDLAIGRWIIAHHAVPHLNYWTQSAHRHYFSDTEWLFALSIAILYHIGGRLAVYSAGVFTLTALSYAIASWVIQLSPLWRWPITVMFGILLLPVIPPRPEILTYLGWWAVLEGLRQYRLSNRRTLLWIMAGATVIWTQIHMTVVLVPLIILWELLAGNSSRRKGLVLPFIVALVGTSLRVGGFMSGAGFFSNVLSPEILNHIVEWMPPNVRSTWGIFVYLWVFGIWGFIVPKIRAHKDYASLGWVIVGTGAALFAQRLVPYMAIGTLMLLISYGPSPLPLPSWIRSLIAIVLLIGLNIPVWSSVAKVGVFTPTWPTSAIHLLKKDHATNIISLQGDTLTGYHLRPWLNGQVQLVSNTSWFPLWIDTISYRLTPAQFAAKVDPSSRWIVWPTVRSTLPPLTLPKPWHVVWHGKIRWDGGTQQVPTAIWEKT